VTPGLFFGRFRGTLTGPEERRRGTKKKKKKSVGSGGMGEVYRARDTKLNREVAIKVLPAALSNDAQYMARRTAPCGTTLPHDQEDVVSHKESTMANFSRSFSP
jgi:serine/threonine protein kinase